MNVLTRGLNLMCSLAVLAAFFLSPIVHANVNIRAHDDAQGVFGEDESGAELFSIRHRSLQQENTQNTFAPPVRAGKFPSQHAWFYAVGGDLFRVDPVSGQIVDRIFYGASILELRVSAQGGLDVKLAVRDISKLGTREYEPTDKDAGVWFPALSPGDAPASGLKQLHIPGGGSWGDALLNANRIWQDLPAAADAFYRRTLDADARKIVDDEFDAWGNVDLTNVFVPLARAFLAQDDGRSADVDKYVAQALAIKSTTWRDDFRLCALMLRLRPQSLEVCGVASRKRAAAGIRAEAVTGLVSLVSTLRAVYKELEAAIESDDVDAVQRAAELQYKHFPKVESIAFLSAAMVDYSSQKSPAHVDPWRKRLEEDLKNPVAVWLTAKEIGLWLVILLGLSLGLLGGALISGIRSGQRQAMLAHKRDPKEQSKKMRFFSWLPRPHWVEIALTVAAVMLLHGAIGNLNHTLRKVEKLAEAPLGFLGDIVDAPEVAHWITWTIAPSPASLAMQTYAKETFIAAQKGVAPTAVKPPVGVVEEILEQSADRHFRFFPSIEAGFGGDIPGWGAFFLFFFALLFVGHVAARLLPVPARIVSYFVPGAAPGLSIFAVCSLSLLTIALVRGFTPLATFFQSTAAPAFPKFFGVSSLFEDAPSGSAADALLHPEATPVWTLVVIVAVVGIHAIFVALDVRRSRKNESQ